MGNPVKAELSGLMGKGADPRLGLAAMAVTEEMARMEVAEGRSRSDIMPRHFRQRATHREAPEGEVARVGRPAWGSRAERGGGAGGREIAAARRGGHFGSGRRRRVDAAG